MRRLAAYIIILLTWAIQFGVLWQTAQVRGEEKEGKPPAGWKEVAKPRFTKVDSLLARDGYLCWTESRLVPETALNRAQSFERWVFRFRLGETKPEQVYHTITTGNVIPLLGAGGVIATRYEYPNQNLFLPGQPAVKLPQVEGYQPKEFTTGGLLCHAQRYHGSGGYYESSLALIPIEEGKARADAPRLLLPWVVGELAPDGFNRYGTFRRGDYLIYALPGPGQPAKSGKVKPGKLMLTVWNEKTKSKVWDTEGTPIAADDRFAYWEKRSPSATVLMRRPLSGKGETSGLAIAGLGVILDFQPPKLLGLFRDKEEWILGMLDLSTGERSDYDVRVPTSIRQPVDGGSEQNRPLYLRQDESSAPYMSLARDADTGVLYASRGAAIYEVPVAARRRWIEPKWEAAADEK